MSFHMSQHKIVVDQLHFRQVLVATSICHCPSRYDNVQPGKNNKNEFCACEIIIRRGKGLQNERGYHVNA